MKKLRPGGAELASSWLPPNPPGLRVPFRRPAGSMCQAVHIRIRSSGVCPATAPPSSGLRASGGGLVQAAALGRRLVPKSCLQIGLSSRGKGSPLLPFLLRVSSCTGPRQGFCQVAFWIQLVPTTPCHCPPIFFIKYTFPSAFGPVVCLPTLTLWILPEEGRQNL